MGKVALITGINGHNPQISVIITLLWFMVIFIGKP